MARQTISALCPSSRPIFRGPVGVVIKATFPCPKKDHRARVKAPERWDTRLTGDVDNIAKATLDAANGLIWQDDRQVVQLTVSKVIAAQGADPGILFTAVELEEL